MPDPARLELPLRLAALALALVEANAPEGSATVLRARANYAAICGAPMPRPAE